MNATEKPSQEVWNPPLTVMPVPQPSSSRAAMISSVERTLRDPAIEIDRVRYATDLLRQLRAEEAEDQFDAAMSAAQAEMGRINQDASNPQTKSRYASYAALDRAVRPIYTRHGFGVTWDTGEKPGENMIRIEALVSGTGHRRRYHIDMPADGIGAKGGAVMTRTHAAGSAITYGRRYLLAMIFNLAIGEDDDGNRAPGGQQKDISPITVEQLGEIQMALKHYDITTDGLIAWLGRHDCPVERLQDIPRVDHARVLNAIKAQGERNKASAHG